MTVKHLDHLNLTVVNLDQTIDWYQRVFGFNVVERDVRDEVPWAVLRSGDALLCVYEHPHRSAPPKWDPATETHGQQAHRINHFSLRITDGQLWRDTIAREGLEVRYGGEVDWPHSTSWYVSDPTGYEIEVALWNDDLVRF